MIFSHIFKPDGTHTHKSLSIFHTDLLIASPVAGSTRLVLLPLGHGCVGWIGLHPQGDSSRYVCAARPLPGTAQTALGSGCDLDHTGL